MRMTEVSMIDQLQEAPNQQVDQQNVISMNINDDEGPKKTDKLIDFDKHLEELKKRTELEIPYTITQTEDAMYIDQSTIMTLEFHYYQNDCVYTTLETQKEQIINGKLCDMEGNEVEHQLGTHIYNDEDLNPMNMFMKKDIKNLKDDKVDILKYQRSLGKKSYFTRVPDAEDFDKNSSIETIQNAQNQKQLENFNSSRKKKKKVDDVLIEGFICLYKTNNQGGMQRLNQVETKMGRTFFKSEHGNMVLTRSTDKRIVSLANFNPNDPDGEYFKMMAWTVKLKPWDIDPKLDQGLNEYYKQNKQHFYELFEIQYVNNCRHLQLCYIETKPRTLQEQQDFEKDLEQKHQASCKGHAKKKFLQQREKSVVEKRNEPRKCKKYVFFDVETGQVTFSYGGVQPQNLRVTNKNGKEVEIYQLGIKIKEIKEENFNSNVMFYVCGDLWDDKKAQEMMIYKWTFIFLKIDFALIISQGSEVDITNFLQKSIKNSIPGGSEENPENFFLFDQDWILKYKFEWEQNITLSANRKFDQFALINQPQEFDSQSCLMVNGPRFKQKEKEGIMEIPFYKLFPNELKITHGRNAIIKNEIFYNQTRDSGISETVCLRLEMKDKNLQIMNFDIQIENYVSQFDQFLQAKKNFSDKRTLDIAQTIYVSRGDQYGVLNTRIPVNFVGTMASDFINEERKTKQYMFQNADHPFLVYNLGQNKLLIQNTLMVKAKQPYILNLDPDESFVNFVQVNRYEDICFFPDDLRVECCSHFLLMVRKTGASKFDFTGNRLYLLLIDPLYNEIQAALFKSIKVFDNYMFNTHDFHVKSIIQSNASRKNDMKYSTYIWTQTYNEIIRSKMLKLQGAQNECEDSDKVLDQQEIIENEKCDDEFEFTNRLFQEKVYMQNDKKGFIYYCQQRDGEATIMESNPRDPKIKSHYPIFTIKSWFIMGFSVMDENSFMLMDDQFNVYDLQRNQNNRGLHVVKELAMKEIQRLDYKTGHFDYICLNRMFSVFRSKIYYFYEERNGCFPTGVFEAESLLNDQNNGIRYIQGPITFSGSNRFYCVYSQNKFKTFLRIFLLPDQTQKTLINDFQNQVNMSSFITGGNILLRVKSRFMIFSNDGEFIDELGFNNGNFIGAIQQNSEEEDSEIEVIWAIKGMGKLGKKIGRNQQDKVMLQIYDFEGQKYDVKWEKENMIINENNKMELLQFSFDNRFFLFTNLLTKQLFVYELMEIGFVEQHSFFDMKDITDSKKTKWKFVLKYEITIKQSFLCKYMYSKDEDMLEYFRENRTLIRIDDQARVKLNYCEKVSLKERKNDLEPEIMNCKLFGAHFVQDGNSKRSICMGYNQTFQFSSDAQDNLYKIEHEKMQVIEHKLSAIRIVQTRWPKSLHDYTQYDTLLQDLRYLENKKVNDIYAKCYYDDLIIIYYGNYLKFGRTGPNQDINTKKDGAVFEMQILEQNNEFFQPINFTFCDDTEIVKLIETIEQDVIQIIAVNYKKNIITIVTWDFIQNCEKNMYQIEPREGDSVGNHVVKGMNYKYNYYIDQNHLTDMEFNIPIRQRNVNQELQPACVSYTQQLRYINDLFNQRKLNEDNKKFLGIEKAHCIYYDLSRMDILLWKNIKELGEDLEMIKTSVSLDSFNLVFDSISLFHYFARRTDILEIIKNKLDEESHHRELTITEKSIPLQILNPDQNNKTALYIAAANQSIRSFEFMVEMLKEGNDEICITKMMLKSLALILTSENDNLIAFFDAAYFEPPQMRIDQFVPWNDDIGNIVFPCHTSVISRDLLLQKLSENGVEVDFEAFKNKSKGTTEYNVVKKQQIVQNKMKLRKFQLDRQFDTGLQDGEQQLKKVRVQALDMDWLFENDNSKILIQILANDANSKVLTQKTISIFIQLMWSKYQPAIIYRVFLPYVVYMLIICYFVTSLSSQFIINLTTDETPKILSERDLLKIIMFTLFPISVVLMLVFSFLELKQVIEDGLEYFQDPWNCIDISIVYCNILFSFMFSCCVFMEKEYYPFQIFNTVGSFSVFFMWLKIFYWCRLFEALAYYVKLIQQTIGESMNFMLMVLIILIAFGLFFMGVDKILQKNENQSYLAEYFNNEYIDSVFSIYMIGALGNFTTDRFRIGETKYIAMAMFMIATFIVSVVFMNMLVAIMGDTFGRVLEGAEENGLIGQINLIDDHIWLLDIAEIFKGQKYVLIVAPSESEAETKDQAVTKIQETKNFLTRCVQNTEKQLSRQIKYNDQDSNFQMANQYEAIKMVMGRLRVLDGKFVAKHDGSDGVNKNGMTGAQIKKKQKEFAQMLSLNDPGNLDISKIKEIAQKWFNIYDTDNDGQVSLKEFQTFFLEMDGIFLTENEINDLFYAFDTDKSGELSIEEFANAIKQSLALDQPDTDEDDIDDISKGRIIQDNI